MKQNIRISARFIGKDSLGYIHGKDYNLLLDKYRGMTIRREDKTGVCTYNSLSSFLRNWDNITGI
jgi:hypothetical protein